MEAALRKAEEKRISNDDVPEILNFDLIELGESGRVKAIQNDEKKNHRPLQTLPFGEPPVFPELRDEIEELLLTPEDIPIHGFQNVQKYWNYERNAENLFDTTKMSCATEIQMARNFSTGEVENYFEATNIDVGLTAQNSMSLKRKPGAFTESVKGETSNSPFWPGGMDLPSIENLIEKNDSSSTLNFTKEKLLTRPPGFNAGIFFGTSETYPTSQLNSNESNNLSINEILITDIDMTDLYVDVDEKDGIITQKESPVDVSYSVDDDLSDEILQASISEKEKKKTEKVVPAKRWAILDDFTNTDDFYRKIPDMAFKYPFELDVFQKRAILHLENHENVLVAAHTSAGKTVVAEYAIALSQNHMRRAIYTSPIKALSNQKFRDFKNTFPEVGLLTGDVQIKPEAPCLIMTTEILRSMLYNGSDVIRDLEWVIFDEIHYINDAERGVVWEEVLIMLPAHVGIILLSATVPNTVEFASWIGKTKKKEVFVVQTQKRPVPLEHFLYTGNSNKTSKELFLILDRKGKFVIEGYRAALQAKKDRATKADTMYGAKGTRQGNPKQDRSIWLSVVQMLKSKEQLPIVAFTLSKRKCDSNADMVKCVDLVTSTEKSHITRFFNKSISRLKGTDRALPQVVWLEELLKQGIGVHHSGILPILKEITEMLFQKGYIKILFATETFAMGVNMPARTVVFDSTRKFDGVNYRELLSSEYIQMAGRAGRRGLDKTGMVVILCKGDVPETADLHKMILGSATKLSSQFRLTYFMILNLLRVKELTVQDMMKRSFAEYYLQKDAPENEKKLEQLKKKNLLLKDPTCSICSIDLKDYYISWAEVFQLRMAIKKTMHSSPSMQKIITPGRVITISNGRHRNALAVVLSTNSLESSKPFSSSENKSSDPLEKVLIVLVLCTKAYEEEKQFGIYKRNTIHRKPSTDELSNEHLDITHNHSSQFLENNLFLPNGNIGQVIEEISVAEISDIIDYCLKVDANKMIDNHKKRLIPRFSADPPSSSIISTGQMLLNLTETFIDNIVPVLHPIKDLGFNDIEFVEKFKRLKVVEEKLCNYECLQCPFINEHFAVMRSNMKMREDVLKLQMSLSDDALELMDEYNQRIEVLKELNYIDRDQNLRHKGRVAFEVNTHEIMITELLINNVLTDLHPAAIVAILSCFVFEQKNTSEPNLKDNLQKVVDQVIEIAERVAITQKLCGLDVTVEEFIGSLHFGLVEVVYEWGRGMSFKDITDLTDVSEGNIVRCIQRLDETCRDVRKAAHVIGVQILCDKMEEGMSLIRRDIVCAASLYTS